MQVLRKKATEMTQKVVRGGTVLTMDSDLGTLEGADILIEDGVIADVEEDIIDDTHDDIEVIDARDGIVMPGLVNTHAHLFQTAVRGVGGDWTLWDYYEHMLQSIRAEITPDDLYLGDLFGALEQLNAGVTSVMDWCHTVNTPAHADRAVDALEDAGIRAVYAYGPPGVNLDAWWDESDRSHPEDAGRLAAERLADRELIDLALALRRPGQATMDTVLEDFQYGRELDAILTMHIGAGAYGREANAEVRRMHDHDLLGPDVNFVHANHLDEVFDIVAETGVSISATPEVEMQMGHGLPATGKVLEAGGRLVLGSDVVSAIGSDMFSPMRFALQTQRALDNEVAVEEEGIVDALSVTTEDVLRAATIEGARALGLGEKVGSVTPGKEADLITIRGTDINSGPIRDPKSTVVLHADPSHVEHVLVAGEPAKADGELVSDLHEERWDDVVASGDRLLRDAGVVSPD